MFAIVFPMNTDEVLDRFWKAMAVNRRESSMQLAAISRR
jgi:hypothetical protein